MSYDRSTLWEVPAPMLQNVATCEVLGEPLVLRDVSEISLDPRSPPVWSKAVRIVQLVVLNRLAVGLPYLDELDRMFLFTAVA